MTKYNALEKWIDSPECTQEIVTLNEATLSSHFFRKSTVFKAIKNVYKATVYSQAKYPDYLLFLNIILQETQVVTNEYSLNTNVDIDPNFPFYFILQHKKLCEERTRNAIYSTKIDFPAFNSFSGEMNFIYEVRYNTFDNVFNRSINVHKK